MLIISPILDHGPSHISPPLREPSFLRSHNRPIHRIRECQADGDVVVANIMVRSPHGWSCPRPRIIWL